MTSLLDLIAALIWFFAWLIIGTLLFFTGVALLPFIALAFLCGRLTKR